MVLVVDEAGVPPLAPTGLGSETGLGGSGVKSSLGGLAGSMLCESTNLYC